MLLKTIINLIQPTTGNVLFDGYNLDRLNDRKSLLKGLDQLRRDVDADGMVYVIDEGNSGRQLIGVADAPIKTIVVGVIDYIALGDKHVYEACGQRKQIS